MKKLTLIFTLLVSTVMFSSPSYAEWTKVGELVSNGSTFYVDFERIKNVDGFVYWWDLGINGAIYTTILSQSASLIFYTYLIKDLFI